ncbi:autotransporter domain-containing protein [Cognatilysobacter segetis]|uniref:autotransporter domain-containing protein n=1 Tax=Cognatilysobacter segetis TaxID=2492394 RepID=UPI00138FFA73|nr:autotransporter domain-containing protein [Lysobacter segetis]
MVLLLAPLRARAQVAPPSDFTTLPGIPGYGTSLPNTAPRVEGERRGSNSVIATALSADGSSVAGTARYLEQTFRTFRGCQLVCHEFQDSGGGAQAFVWSDGVTTGLGYPSNATGELSETHCGQPGCGIGIRESIATGISADGRVVVGYGHTGCLVFCGPVASQAFVWTAAQGLREIPGLDPPGSTRALGVSGDGATVVGSSGEDAFAWTVDGGTRRLVGLDDGPASASAASFDGRWIVGESGYMTSSPRWGRVFRATLWDAEGVAVDLGSVGNEPMSSAADISFDGNVAVGHGFADGIPVAFRWTRSGGIVGLGTLPGQTGSMATAVSGDGNVVVGDTSSTPIGFVASLPFRWTAAGGMQSVAAWLAGGGVGLPPEVVLSNATDTNYNGNVVIGTYRRTDAPVGSVPNGYAYLARVGDAGSGFIADLDTFRAGVAATGLLTLDSAALLSTGALATARRPGGWNAARFDGRRGCGWVSASRTRYRNDGPDVDAQELGGCFDTGPVRLAAGVGRMDTTRTTPTGRGDLDGHYALLGVAVPLDRLEASLTAYRGRFDGTVERRYANGAATDVSVARPEGDFDAAVVRFDWTDVVRRGRLGLSPYLAYAWSRTDIEAHTETGGGFPVAYGASSVRSRELAAGVMADLQLSPVASIGLGLETARRRIDTGDGVSAQVVGLFDASAPGMRSDDSASHALLRLRYAFAPAFDLQADARAGIDGQRDVELRLQLRAAF